MVQLVVGNVVGRGGSTPSCQQVATLRCGQYGNSNMAREFQTAGLTGIGLRCIQLWPMVNGRSKGRIGPTKLNMTGAIFVFNLAGSTMRRLGMYCIGCVALTLKEVLKLPPWMTYVV